MRLNLPTTLTYIMEKLKQHGYEVYAVGGALRDALLNRPVSDWDLATSAKPEMIQKLFPDAIATGAAHGTYTVRSGEALYEVTTFRVDGPYLDGRHPQHVEFVTNIHEDLARRDFTINALAYNPWAEASAVNNASWIDPWQGRIDLNNKLIRTVGESNKRFSEDGLRLMRAARFAAQLGFSIEAETYQSMAKLSPLIKRISQERIQAELTRILATAKADTGIEILADTGLLALIMPELCKPAAHYKLGISALRYWLRASAWQAEQPLIGLAVLLFALPVSSVRLLMQRLKYSNADVATLQTWLMHLPEALKMPNLGLAQNRLLKALTPKLTPGFLQLLSAVLLAKSPQQRLSKTQVRWLIQFNELLQSKHIWRTADLAVDGNDVMAVLNLGPGKKIGAVLDKLLELTWQDVKLNEREILLQWMVEKWRRFYTV